MRPLPLLLCLVLAPALSAQVRSISPHASQLFQGAATDTTSDPVKIDTGIPQPLGRMLGLIGGAGVGYVLARITESGPGTCDTAPSCPAPKTGIGGRVTAAAIFGMIGLWIGGELTGPKAPRS